MNAIFAPFFVFLSLLQNTEKLASKTALKHTVKLFCAPVNWFYLL